MNINEQIRQGSLLDRARELFMPQMYLFTSIEDFEKSAFKTVKREGYFGEYESREFTLEPTRKITAPILSLMRVSLFTFPSLTFDDYCCTLDGRSGMATLATFSDTRGEIKLVHCHKDLRMMDAEGNMIRGELPAKGSRIYQPVFFSQRAYFGECNRSKIGFLGYSMIPKTSNSCAAELDAPLDAILAYA